MVAVLSFRRCLRDASRAVAAGAALMGAPLAVAAQEAVPPGRGTLDTQRRVSDSVKSAVQLKEMSVTATKSKPGATTASAGLKTDAPLIETPQAISVITSEQIEAQDAQTMQEVLRYSAGVRAEMYGVDNRGDWFSLRGGSEGSTVLDGLRLPLSGWYGNVRNEPYAFDRVEVLRGPASVLYGQNGPGGVVSLVSKRPQATARREVGVRLGNRSAKEVTADFTGPLNTGGSLLYRIVGLAKDGNTQVQYADEQRQFIAPSLTWLPDGATSITTYAQFQRDRSKNNVGFFPWAGTLLSAPNGRIDDAVFIGEPTWDGYGGERTRAGYQVDRQLNAGWRVRHDLRYDHVNGRLRGMYANFWEGLLEDGRSVNRTWYASRTDTRITNLDLLVTGKVAIGRTQHSLLFGGDGLWVRDVNPDIGGAATPLDVYAPEYGTFALPELAFGADNPTRTKQFGLTVQDQAKFGERLVLLAGLRHDWATVDVDGSPTAGADVNAWTHRLGAVYQVGGGVAPYASYSTSFEVVTGSDNAGTPYKPKRGKQWEAGVKWMPASGRVVATAAAYKLKERNRLTTDPVDPTNSVQRGEVTVNGVELDVNTRFAGLDVAGAYTFADATMTASSDPADPYLHKRLASIPSHSASLLVTHSFPVRVLDDLRAGAGLRYVGKSWDGQDLLATPSNTLVDAMMSFGTGRWQYAINATNVLDKVYFATCLDRGDCWYGSRRTIAVKAAYRY